MSTTRRSFNAALLGAPFVLSSPAAFAQSAPPQLRIGFQKSAVNLVILKQQGVLEKKFPNTKVQWLEFPAGPQLLEALAVGSLELGMTGDSPPVFAQAASKDLFYVGIEPPKPLSSAVLVPGNSPIRSLQELKGKRVAFQKGSSAHYLTVATLEKAGLQWSDITPIYVAPSDARAAFEKGAIDAWTIWDPFYAAAELDVKPRVLTNGVGLSNNNSFYLASRPLVEQHGAALNVLLDALTQAEAWVHGNRKEVAQYISDLSGLSLATVHLFLSRRPKGPVAPLTAANVADQQRVADTFHRIGLIPKPIKVADIVWQSGRARGAQA